MQYSSELYDRMLRFEGWDMSRLGPDALTLVIAAEQWVSALISKLASCIGIERQVVLSGDLARGLDISEETEVHNWRATVEVHGLNHRFMPSPDRKVIYLVDAGDPRFDFVQLARGADHIGFALKEGGLSFGTDLDLVRSGRLGLAVEPRAEVLVLLGELLNGVCSLTGVYRGPRQGAVITLPPECATIPLVDLPEPEEVRTSCRLYTAGLGGAISHQFSLAAFGLDPILRKVFLHPDSVIVGADPQLVEESNRSRQVGYGADSLDQPKARETRRWIAERLLPGARLEALEEVVSAEHFSRYGPFDAVLSSVDSWGKSGRLQLAELCLDSGVPALVSAGSSFFGGFVRLVTEETACPFECGVEKLNHRKDRTAGALTAPSPTSCTAREAPAPSSLVPQAILGGLGAMILRQHLLGREVDARGYKVHLLDHSREPCFSGLRYSPGRRVNERCTCEKQVPGRRSG